MLTILMHIAYFYDMSHVITYDFLKSKLWAYVDSNSSVFWSYLFALFQDFSRFYASVIR